jgi:glucose dehydrogenase
MWWWMTPRLSLVPCQFVVCPTPRAAPTPRAPSTAAAAMAALAAKTFAVVASAAAADNSHGTQHNKPTPAHDSSGLCSHA